MATKLDINDNLLTPEQVAVKLGVSVITLQKWRCNGLYNLEYVKMGRLIMYDPDDIDVFIEERKRKHT